MFPSGNSAMVFVAGPRQHLPAGSNEPEEFNPKNVGICRGSLMNRKSCGSHSEKEPCFPLLAKLLGKGNFQGGTKKYLKSG
jgi:hypothetical protein